MSTIIKLTEIAPENGTRIRLTFSDGASGVYDFAPFVDAATEMTSPLRDPEYFSRCFIEAGALAWPNGFDLNVESLYCLLDANGNLRRYEAA